MHGCDVIQKQVCPHNYRLTEIGNFGEGMQAGGAEVLTEGDGETLQLPHLMEVNEALV